ncbi:MAG: alpha/beta fold hydrolase [Pseudomonadota bacterium]
MPLKVFVGALMLVFAVGAKAGPLDESGHWPAARMSPERADILSFSPFSLFDAARGSGELIDADVVYYPPQGADGPAPAVILLHGAGGVSEGREHTYARQFAAQGVGAAIINIFSPRGGFGFIERLMTITEAMALADSFAVLDWLVERPEIDGERVAVIGFSYGGMSATYAAYRQVVDAYLPDVPFAAHVAVYGPCIARFEQIETTGAPIMMMWGTEDAIMDAEECAATAEDLREGGSEVVIETFEARHRWDSNSRHWRTPAHLADCRFRVRENGVAEHATLPMHMSGPAMRTIMLGLCANTDGYLIGGDPEVRIQSNAALARFLNPVLFPN